MLDVSKVDFKPFELFGRSLRLHCITLAAKTSAVILTKCKACRVNAVTAKLNAWLDVTHFWILADLSLKLQICLI